jgi:hypothetical protein
MPSGHRLRGAMDVVSEPSTTPARPPQVTFACGIVMVGSVFVVLMMWDRIAGLHTLDSRTGLQSFLHDTNLDSSGLTVADLMVTVKVLAMVAAGCATAMVILGWQTLQRSRSARLGLAILAVPLFVTGLATDGIVSSGVAAAVLTLWLGPARTWFSDAPTPAPDATTAGQTTSPSIFRAPPPPTSRQTPNRPVPPTSTHPSAREWAPPTATAYDVRSAPHRVARADVRRARPQQLVLACLLTWSCASLIALVLAGSMVMLAADNQTLLDRMHEQDPQLAEQGISDHTVLVIVFVMCAVLMAWALASAAFAALLFRGHHWAWYALTISASGAAVVCLLGVLGSVVVLIPLAAILATIGFLTRPDVRAWAAGR